VQQVPSKTLVELVAESAEGMVDTATIVVSVNLAMTLV
jgi:hypothetical protein